MNNFVSIFLLLLISTSSAHSASIRYNGTEIVGIDGVSVGGILYDASFHNLWSGTLYTGGFALQASFSLFSLFSDSGEFSGSDFDLFDNSNVVGIESNYNVNYFFTAYRVNENDLINGYAFINRIGASDASDIYRSLNSSISDSPHLTYVDWQISPTPVSAVPLPHAAFLFGPALLGFLGLRRHKPVLS